MLSVVMLLFAWIRQNLMLELTPEAWLEVGDWSYGIEYHDVKDTNYENRPN